jgi:hypothetical protein
MPIELYRGIADADLAALVAYLSVQPEHRRDKGPLDGTSLLGARRGAV